MRLGLPNLGRLAVRPADLDDMPWAELAVYLGDMTLTGGDDG